MGLIKFLLVFFFSLGCLADRGGWISSGGEVFKNAKNPWFVKNTKEVSYCAEFSESEFTISKADSLVLIQDSIQYWKKQMDGVSAISIPSSVPALGEERVQVATQDFKFNASCSGKENLIFKFGYDSLNAEEIKYMETPEKYLGLTIRKEYDEVNLIGAGIIFVSGDLGKHSYKKTSADAVDEAWKYPKLLQYVLIHELGHVFGLPHSGSGLMSEVFLDQLLIRKFAAMYVREPISPFIKPAEFAEICSDSVMPKGSQDFVAPYFSLNYKEDCLKFEVSQNRKEFSILTKKIKETQWKKIGSLFIDRNELIDYSLKPALVLQLTADQKVFNALNSSFLIGPIFQNYKVDGHINFGTSLKPYPVQIDLSPDAVVVYGFHDNRIRQVFSFGNPLLFSLSNPF